MWCSALLAKAAKKKTVGAAVRRKEGTTVYSVQCGAKETCRGLDQWCVWCCTVGQCGEEEGRGA